MPSNAHSHLVKCIKRKGKYMKVRSLYCILMLLHTAVMTLKLMTGGPNKHIIQVMTSTINYIATHISHIIHQTQLYSGEGNKKGHLFSHPWTSTLLIIF